MNEEAKELREFTRNVPEGEAALAQAMDSYFEWGGPFEEDKFLKCLENGVAASARAYANLYGSGNVGEIFSPATLAMAARALFDEVKERYSMSEVARSLFLTIQTDGAVYGNAITPLVERSKLEALRGQLDEQKAANSFNDIIRKFVPGFERRQRMHEEPHQVLASDVEQVTRELKDYYFEEAGVRKVKQSVDFALPMTLGVEQDNGDFAVLATFNNQSGSVPAKAFRSMVEGFISHLDEAGVDRPILLVNREDAPAALDEFEIQAAPIKPHHLEVESPSL